MLFRSPTLLWFVAPYLARYARTPVALRFFLGLKRRKIFEMASGRQEAWLVRFLEQLPPTEGSVAARGDLQKLLTTPQALENLRHCRGIGWPLLSLAARYAAALASPVIRDIFYCTSTLRQKQSALSAHNHLVRDTLRLGEHLGIEDVQALVAHCKTWRHLSNLHERWTARINEINFAKKVAEVGDDLPPPPFPGTQDIVPIATVTELLTEGAVMHHCVGSYLNQIRAGRCYIYKVTAPDRATAEIVKGSNGDWLPAQIKGPCNGKPGMPTVIAVQQWLMQMNGRTGNHTE